MPTIKINKTTNPHNSNTKKTQKIPQFVIKYNPSQIPSYQILHQNPKI